MKQLVTPFGETHKLIVPIQVFLLIALWAFSGSYYIPSLFEVTAATIDLVVNKGVLREFITSIFLCIKAIGVALLISLIVAYGVTIPITRPISLFITRFRFLPTVGISFLFMKLSHNVQEQKVMLLVFGITVFLVTSVVSVVLRDLEKRIDYATTLGLSPWEKLREVVILEKLPDVVDSMRQNFAIAWTMLATIENLCKTDGGIGVILADSNKWFKFEYVYSIQILILLTGIGLDWFLNKLKYWFFPQIKPK